MSLKGGLGVAPPPAEQAGHQAGESFVASSGLGAPAVDKLLGPLEGSRAGRGGTELQPVLRAGDQGGLCAGEASAAGQALLIQDGQVVLAEVQEKFHLLVKREGLVPSLG